MNPRALKTCVFYCSNHPVSDQFARHYRHPEGDTVQAISLPCSGKVDVPYLVKAFETGADGVVILTCSKADCHHLEGTARAYKRAEAVDALLEEIGLGTGRIAVLEWPADGLETLLGKITTFFDGVRNLPPLPAQGSAVNP